MTAKEAIDIVIGNLHLVNANTYKVLSKSDAG